MSRLPRDLAAESLVQCLRQLGYSVIRQRGSHMTLRTAERGGHTIWLPKHNPVAPGTLHTALKSIALHFGMDLNSLLEKLDL